MLPKDSKELLGLFNSNGVEYVVVGAFAVAFYGHPRFTGDLDLLIRPTVANAASIIHSLNTFGFGSLGLAASDFLQPGLIIQLGFAPNRIDLLTSLSGLTIDEAFASPTAGEVAGIAVRYISLDALLRNKRATGRPQDLADADRLSR